MSQWEFLPWVIMVAFPKERQLQQSRATQPYLSKVHIGLFRVSIIHRTMTWTTGSLTCVRDYSYACVYTRGLIGTSTASRHNIIDSKKLTHFACAPDWIRTIRPLDHESDALPIEPPRHPTLLQSLKFSFATWFCSLEGYAETSKSRVMTHCSRFSLLSSVSAEPCDRKEVLHYGRYASWDSRIKLPLVSLPFRCDIFRFVFRLCFSPLWLFCFALKD